MTQVRIIHESTDDRFAGRYKGHEIEIDREEDGRFYIIVKNAAGGVLYDGWWAGSDKMPEAVDEAVKGACLA